MRHPQTPLPFLGEVPKDAAVRRRDRRYDPHEEEALATTESVPAATREDESSEKTSVDSSDDDDSSLGETVSSSSSASSSSGEGVPSEEEENESQFRVKSLSEQWEDFKAKQRDRRRHPTLEYFERQLRKEQELYEEEEEARRLALERRKEDDDAKRRQRREARQFQSRVAADDAARQKRTLQRRQRQHAKTAHLMRLYSDWDREEGDEEDDEKPPGGGGGGAAPDNLDDEKTKSSSKDDDDDEVPRFDEEVDPTRPSEATLKAEEDLSQEVLRLMRQAGVTPGVNAPAPDEPEEPRETDEAVVLRLRRGAPPSSSTEEEGTLLGPKGERKKRKKKRASALAIDLGRFRNVERLKGEHLGPTGAVDLAADLASGACPHLTALDLGWNRIEYRGLRALAAAFRKSSPPLLQTLDLRANHLGADAVALLVDALGTLTKLRTLDLRHNLLRDRGACLLASTILAGDFKAIEVLILQHNDIGAQGIFAIFKALTAKALPTLCPAIAHVSLRFNKPGRSSDLFRTIGDRCPTHLSL